MLYSIRFIHKIAPSDKDVGEDIEIGADTVEAATAAFKKAGLSVRNLRREADGRFVSFPTDIWHSVIATPKGA